MKRALLPALFALACCAAGQATKDAEALLSKMRAAYGALKTAKLSTHCSSKGNRKSVEIDSDMLFKAPNNFSLESKLPADLNLKSPVYKVTTNGKNLRVEGLPGGTLTEKFTVEELQRNLPQCNLEVLCLWDWKQQLSTDLKRNMHFSKLEVKKDTWNGKTWTVLEETATGQFIRYFIDPKSNLIWRTIVSTGTGATFQDVWITKYEVGPSLSSSLFNVPGLPKD